MSLETPLPRLCFLAVEAADAGDPRSGGSSMIDSAQSAKEVRVADSCPVCLGADVRTLAPYRHANKVFAGLSRAACDSCGMVFAIPMPDPQELSRYNAGYFAQAHGGTPTDRVSIAFHSAVNLLRVAHVENYATARGIRISRVLEIGAGGGHFARHWLGRHAGCRYHAIESDISLHDHLRDLGVELCDTIGSGGVQAATDLVVMSHVLEHTSDPAAFIGDMTAQLQPGGVLFIEVPCRDFEYKDMDEPHLLFFDKGPLGKLLGACGFGDVQLTYHGESIDRLSPQSSARLWPRIRGRLLALGLVAPFARREAGLDIVRRPLERAVVGPFEAHREQDRPARWLRAVARKL